MFSEIKSIIGIPWHENLETHYTQSWDLIENLQEVRFSGYLQVEFWGYEGYLIFDTGDVIQGFETDRGGARQGREALLNIYRRLKQPDGTISTFKVDPEWLPIVQVSLSSKAVRTERDLSEKAIKEMIGKAVRETEYGIVKIQYGSEEAMAHILFKSGQIINTVLQSKDGKERKENGAGQLFGVVMKLTSTISTQIHVKTYDAQEFYKESRNFREISELVQASEYVLTLIRWFRDLVSPYMTGPQLNILFDGIWSKSCADAGVENVQIKNDRMENLEQVSPEELGILIRAWIANLKPDVEMYLDKKPLVDQLITAFYRINRRKLDKIGLNQYFSAS